MTQKFMLFLIAIVLMGCTAKKPAILAFSKTDGFRHSSIPAGKAALIKLGKENDFSVDTTENAAVFTDNNLKKYRAVVFLNTTDNVLNETEQVGLKNFIRNGGGFVGIHAATDTEFDWPWYNKLVGAYFVDHPKVQEATLVIKDKNHPATDFLGDTWQKTDEWYNFRDINPDINVLITIDESTYSGGTNGKNHPISWYHIYDGGKVFYTAMGHTAESYTDELFLKHVLGGIQYVISEK